MTVLVTGGTGFVGRNLVERLVRGGESVRCLARSPARAEDLRQLGAEIVVGDITTGEGLREAAAGVSVVYHCAGVVRAWSRHEYFETNAAGTGRMAAAARVAGARRFVLVSSLAASGPAPQGGEVTEATKPRPINAYGESKLQGEMMLALSAHGLPWTVVRPTIVYGPHDRDVLVLFRAAARGLVPYTAWRGSRVSLVHVEDLADLIVLAGERAPPGRVYLASDGAAYSWEDLVSAVGSAVGRRARGLRIPPALLALPALCVGALRPFLRRPPLFSFDKVREAAQSWTASSARAQAELGWKPRLGLAEGARLTAEWYRARGWL